GLAPAAVPATGALLLSPRLRAGVTDDTPTGPYALLRTLEDLFGLPPLGHAADPTVTPYDSAVLATSSPASTTPIPTTRKTWRSP
ncbi:MAG: hypothetical protein JWM31_1760, partial [Solirubrobacterales bacterium]|nr:hypothetical protein [Solirubrobacterales bacterium]